MRNKFDSYKLRKMLTSWAGSLKYICSSSYSSRRNSIICGLMFRLELLMVFLLALRLSYFTLLCSSVS